MLFWVGILPLARSEEVIFEGEGGIEAPGVSEDGCGELRPSRDEAGGSCSLLLCAPLGADRAACLCSGGMGNTTKLRALVVDDLQVSDVCWVLTLVVRDVCKQVAAGR